MVVERLAPGAAPRPTETKARIGRRIRVMALQRFIVLVGKAHGRIRSIKDASTRPAIPYSYSYHSYSYPVLAS